MATAYCTRTELLRKLVGRTVKDVRFASNGEDIIFDFEGGVTAYFLRDHPLVGERGMVVRLEKPGNFVEYI